MHDDPDYDETSTAPNEEETAHTDHSPESAGIVRGISNSSKSIAKLRRPQLRIKPTKVPKTATSISTKSGTSIFKNAGTKNKAIATKSSTKLKNNVAKISDRASKGVDVVSSFDETLSSSDSNSNQESIHKQKVVPKKIPKAAIFSIHLLQNTLLGALVFTAYEECIQYFNINSSDTTFHDTLQQPYDDAFARVSVSKHFLSGGLAGFVYGILTTTIESIKLSTTTPTINIPSARTLFVSLFHQFTSHAILFGGYESLKRLLLFHFTQKTYLDFLYHEDRNNIADDHDSSLSSFVSSQTTKQLMCISVAGGVSGSMQQIFSHYAERIVITEHLKFDSSSGSNGGIGNQSLELKKVRRGTYPTLPFSQGWKQYLIHSMSSTNLMHSFTRIQAPSIRPLLFAFPMNAIGFIAFEYGRDIIMPSSE